MLSYHSWPPHGAAELIFIWHKFLLLQVGNIGVHLAWLCPKVYNNPSERKDSLREWVPKNCCDPRSLILRERQGWSQPEREISQFWVSWGSDISGIRKTTPWPGPCDPYCLIKHKPHVKSYMVTGPPSFFPLPDVLGQSEYISLLAFLLNHPVKDNGWAL